MEIIKIRKSVYHDSSTKGFRHGIKHKRHDCWRADIRVFLQQPDGTLKQISRRRKRFKSQDEGKEWIKNN